jgi:adenylate cyclase
MEAEIVISSPEGDLKSVRIADIATIGRSPDNNLVIPSGLVSRNHALIRYEGDQYVIIDLGSANGTFLNGRPVATATKINDGDEIRMGDTVLRFQCAGQAPRKSKRSGVGKTTARVFANVTLCVLVTDVRNYTSLSERIPAEELSTLLADWFDTAGRCIADHGGTIEQFRGDCVMTYWLSAPGDTSNDYVMRAIDTARELVRLVERFDKRFSDQYPGQSFKIGCGIHMGDAVLGSIGPDARRDLTTLGDSVNVTFRIEALCSTLGEQIMVSEAINQAVGDAVAFRDLGPHALKGKSAQVRLYALR